jgi:hypothetical protein
MIEKNNFAMGLLIGALTPIIGFTIIEFLFNLLTDFGLMEEVTVSISPRRERTIGLLAICFNLIPFQYCKNKKWDNTMRGIIFPTMIYVGFWIYRYKAILF